MSWLMCSLLGAGTSMYWAAAGVEGCKLLAMNYNLPHCPPAGPQGYCLFNNVALAAKHAQQQLGLKKVGWWLCRGLRSLVHSVALPAYCSVCSRVPLA